MSFRTNGIRVFQRTFTQTCIKSNIRPQIPSDIQSKILRAKTRAVIGDSSIFTQGGSLKRIRTVPKYPAFFGGNPVHQDNMHEVEAILKRYASYPKRTVPVEELESSSFVSFDEYKKQCGSGVRVKEIHHKELISAVQQLRSIDLQLMPESVSEILKKFSGSSGANKIGQVKKVKTLDANGRAHGKAKRKSSKAEVWVVKGEGQIMVNGTPIVEYFPQIEDRKKIVYPFVVVEQEAKYNIFATVSGGGRMGQSEAVMYAVAKALVVHNPLLKPRLRKAGLMTSDARTVERKKPGRLKARKSPTWVKR